MTSNRFPLDDVPILELPGMDTENQVDFWRCTDLFGNKGADSLDGLRFPDNLRCFQQAFSYLSHQHVFAFNAIRGRIYDDFGYNSDQP